MLVELATRKSARLADCSPEVKSLHLVHEEKVLVARSKHGKEYRLPLNVGDRA